MSEQPMNGEAGRGLGAARGSAHPWRMQMSASQRIAAAKKEGARRKRLAQYAEDTKDPVYRQAMTATHVAWETNKYHSDPEWAAKRKDYYKRKRASAPNDPSSPTPP